MHAAYPFEDLGQSRFAASTLHCHADVDFPPSPSDLKALFMTDPHIQLLHPSIFVITNSTKYIIFRGQNTPKWTEDFVSKKINSWESQLGEREAQFVSEKQSYHEQLFISWRSQTALLNQIAHKYDLKIFTCPRNQNIATRIN
jgi:hypothetical protein